MTMNDVNNKSPFSQHDDVEMNDAAEANEEMSDVEEKPSQRRQLRKKRLDNGQRTVDQPSRNGGWDADKPCEMPSALEAVTALNPALFPPGQLSIQTFQNAISQFTATAVANNMDNDTIMKNLAILQSALFTLQQQQFLQFQLIQHLQTELIKKQSEKNTNDEANKVESDGENDKNNGGDHDHDDNDDNNDDGDNDEDDEMEKSRKINSLELPRHRMQQAVQQPTPPTSRPRPAKMPNDGRSSGGEMYTRDPEIRVRTPTKLIEQPIPPPVPEKLTVLPPKPPTATSTNHQSTISQEEIATYQKNFPSLASNIITDHDNSPLVGESSSLAMLEKKAQEVLNSASQGILSNNFMDELAFANDKANAGTRNDSALFKHRCRYCGKIFGSDSSLQIHLRSHTGERPYKCNICGSRFTTKGNLKVHFQRHSDKYPHIPMNPNPVPEHLDKYFPALMPQEALKDGSSPPAQMPPQMPTQFPGLDPRHMPPRGMFPDFFLPRPPFDLFSPIKEPSSSSKNPVDLSQLPMRKPEQFSPRPKTPEEPARPPPTHQSPQIKEEPTDLSEMPDRPVSSMDQADRSTPHDSHDEFEEAEAERKANNNSELNQSDKDSHLNRSLDGEKKDDAIDAKMQSVSPPSSSSSTSGSLYQDTVLDPAFYSSRLMRPENNDASWENFIEISSETSKLQDLVDNIDNKNSEPNQCLVCKKVLSCRSALQMHYRVHTGDRPFRCKICGRSFTTKGNLKTHMSVHRIKPPMRTLHQCPVCHQKFSNIFVLQQHIRLHTGEMTDLTPEQIRAAEIRDFDSPPMRVPPEFHAQKRIAEFSDDESNGGDVREKSPKQVEPMSLRSRHSLRSKQHQDENHAEDLRAKHMQRLSVRSSSNDGYSRGSSPDSQMSGDQKRMRSSSPQNSHHTKSPPMPTPPTVEQIAAANAAMAAAAASGRPFPYGPPFFGMPQFPPFMTQPQFMRNLPLMPQAGAAGATASPFGLFGARGNTTTCNICFKTFACNSALEIHYRSHTKERPFKCTICDRGFSTKGNMKQHMLTHKTRDSNGNCSSGDEESHLSSRSSQPDASSRLKVAIKMKRPQSPSNNNNVVRKSDDGHNSADEEARSFLSAGQYSMDKEADIKKWCNKLNEMPENIAAS